MLDYFLSFLILTGAVFTFIGSLGLARLRDFYTRLHGPTKATTLGVGSLLIASANPPPAATWSRSSKSDSRMTPVCWRVMVSRDSSSGMPAESSVETSCKSPVICGACRARR